MKVRSIPPPPSSVILLEDGGDMCLFAFMPCLSWTRMKPDETQSKTKKGGHGCDAVWCCNLYPEPLQSGEPHHEKSKSKRRKSVCVVLRVCASRCARFRLAATTTKFRHGVTTIDSRKPRRHVLAVHVRASACCAGRLCRVCWTDIDACLFDRGVEG